jgi:hypothetical protein
MKMILSVVSLLLFGGAPAWAVPIVQSNVTPIGGGLFHFEFSVTNDSIDDIVLVSIDAPPGDASIGATLLAPLGFLASYDSGLGIIDFLEGTDLFSVGTTITGFSFDSNMGPGNGAFDDFSGLTVDGDTFSGTVETTVVSAVPEPSTAASVAVGAAVLIGLLVRHESKRRRSPHLSGSRLES